MIPVSKSLCRIETIYSNFDGTLYAFKMTFIISKQVIGFNYHDPMFPHVNIEHRPVSIKVLVTNASGCSGETGSISPSFPWVHDASWDGCCLGNNICMEPGCGLTKKTFRLLVLRVLQAAFVWTPYQLMQVYMDILFNLPVRWIFL